MPYNWGMAIFNRVLDFFNGDMGPVEPQRFQVPMSQPYVDDMFDPLFNRDVVSYNRDLYGTLGAIPAGYAQMWDNALTGREGILGPGMGILSTFGRSMDKADDFILGGLTEGVNTFGRFVGTNDAPSNPISNIFVEDQDYEGSDLLAAMGNAMGKMAGGAKLDRSDFSSLPDRLQSSTINLATDPGFMGGSVARANPANKVASALNDYDDLMADVAGNMAVPGAKAAAQAGLRNLINLVGGAMNKPYKDYRFTDDEASQYQLRDMMSTYSNVGGGTDFLDDREYAVYRTFVTPEYEFGLDNPGAMDGVRLASAAQNVKASPDAPITLEDLDGASERAGDLPDPDALLNAYEESQMASYRTALEGIPPTAPVLRRFDEVIPQSEGLDLSNPSDAFVSDVIRDFDKRLGEQRYGIPSGMESMQQFADAYRDRVGKLDDVSRAEMVDRLRSLYDEDGFAASSMDAVADASGGNVAIPRGAGYLTISDADSRRATAERYVEARESIIQDAANSLSAGSKRGASKAEHAVINALSEYTRTPKSLYYDLHAHRKGSTGHAMHKIVATLRTDDPTVSTDLLDDFSKRMASNPKASPRKTLQESLWSTSVYRIGSYRKMGYDEVSDAYRDFLNSLGANLPEGAKLDACAKWYSDNKSFVDAVPRIMSSDDVEYTFGELPKAVQDRVMEWYKFAEGHSPSGFAYRMSQQYSSLQDAKKLSKGFIERWHFNKKALDARKDALLQAARNARDAGAKTPPPELQAQWDDIMALERFVDRMERLEKAASPTVPEYIRKLHPELPTDPSTPKSVLYSSTTSEYLGNDMKSMMDWLDANPSKAAPGLSWQLRPNQKVLANDLRPDGKQVRPEARLLTAFVQPGRLSEKEWDYILHPYWKGGDMSLHPKNQKNLLKDVYLKPARPVLDINGQKAYEVSDEAIPFLVEDPANPGWFKTNPEITAEAAKFGEFEFRGRLAEARADISIENGDIYVGPAAFNYFTRHADDHRPVEYLSEMTALNQRMADGLYGKEALRLSDWTPEETAKLATDPPKMGDLEWYSLSDSLTSDIARRWNMDSLDPINPDHISFIKRVGSPREQSLFAYLARMAVGARNAKLARGKHGFLNDRTLGVIRRARAAKDKYSQEDISEYLRQRDAASDAVVKAEDFVGSLVNSEGFKAAVVRGREASNLLSVLESNVKKVNDAAGEPVLKVVHSQNKDGTEFVGYAFNGSDLKIKRHLNDYVRDFDGERLGLRDVVFQRGTGSYGKNLNPEMVRELDAIFNDTRDLLNEYTGRLGFTPFSDNYFRHDLTDDESNDFHFAKRKSELGVDDARDVAAALSDIREFDQRTHRVLGTKAFDRSWYGDFSYYGTGFSHDIEDIVHSTFTKGALDNANANLAQELFFNRNFSLRNNFADPKQLMDALRQEGSSNMTNLQIVVPRYDGDGVLTGFSRIDAYDDAGILKAFENEDAVLVPKSIFGKLDRVLKKEAKMGNSAYRFFQKYMTVPFKLGVISNLGFLFGNVQDASFKQVESFMRRYGTSMPDECFSAAVSYKHAVDLQNKFSDVVDKYVAYLGGDVDRRDFQNSLATIRKTGTVDPALITSNPHYLDEFNRWLENQSDEYADTAKLYLFAHSIMDAGTFENNYLDLEDLAQAGNKETANRYDKPINLADRVLYGDRSAGEKSFEHGPFKGKRLAKPGIVTNPGTNAVLRPSNVWEHTTRLATVLNYMRHEGWSDESIAKALGSPYDEAAMQKLRMDMLQGVDMMNHANFDYDDVTEFMDKVSYIVPFPTFYLKNIAHWMEVFAEHPQMIDDIVSYQEGLWQHKDVKDDEFAAEAKGRGAYPMGGRTKFGTGIVKQSPINSMFSAFSAVNNFKEDFAYRTNPVARPITRHLQKPEDVKYRPYSTAPYEKNIRKGDKQFSELAYMFHQLNPYERYVNTYMRTPRKVATNDYQASDFLPSVFQPDFGKKRR